MRRARYNDNENRAINFHTSFPIVSTIYEFSCTQFAQSGSNPVSAEKKVKCAKKKITKGKDRILSKNRKQFGLRKFRQKNVRNILKSVGS